MRGGTQAVAVKVFPSDATDIQMADFQKEVVILKSCRDRNIVQFLGACVTDTQTCLITECASWSPQLPTNASPLNVRLDHLDRKSVCWNIRHVLVFGTFLVYRRILDALWDCASDVIDLFLLQIWRAVIYIMVSIAARRLRH